MGGTIISICRESEEPLGIYTAEGRERRSGSFLQNWFHRQPQTALVVICRGRGEKRDETAVRASEERVVWLLTAFERWFCHDFPADLHPFSADVVKCYWQSMIREVLEMGQPPLDVAALLVHAGHYILCSQGSLSVYEVTCSGQTCRRLFTGVERRRLDEELGISQDEISELSFRNRKIREKTLLFLCQKEICPKDLHSLYIPLTKINFQGSRFKKGMEELAERDCCVAVVAADTDGGRRW